jgi:hypothetical protein
MNVSHACYNAESEIPDFDFGTVLTAAQKIWREKLSAIQVDATGVNEELQTVFWSGAYRAMLSPQDYTGENPLVSSCTSEKYHFGTGLGLAALEAYVSRFFRQARIGEITDTLLPSGRATNLITTLITASGILSEVSIHC